MPFIRRNTKIDRQRERRGSGWRNNEVENDYRGMRGGHSAEEGVRDRSEVKESVNAGWRGRRRMKWIGRKTGRGGASSQMLDKGSRGTASSVRSQHATLPVP